MRTLTHFDKLALFTIRWWEEHRSGVAEEQEPWNVRTSYGPLPGEGSGHHVFVMEFGDGCYYFGFTQESIDDRVLAITTGEGGWPPNLFASQHAQIYPFTLRCVRSGLSRDDARQIRDYLVIGSPYGRPTYRGSVAQSPECGIASRQRGATERLFNRLLAEG